MPFENIFDGTKRSDGTVATLSDKDQRCCIMAWDGLIRRHAFLFEKLDPALHDTDLCLSVEKCKNAKVNLGRQILPPVPQRDICPLDPWSDSWERGLCSNCMNIAKASHMERRQKIWDDLPEIFDLPPWDELIDS